MKIFGMERKELFAFGIGSALNGGLLGALYHDPFILVVNVIALGLNIYLFNAVGETDGN